MFGLPISGVTAAAIVCVFQAVAPTTKDASGQVSFDFGAKFSGPAVPATLWIATYLALVVTIVAITGGNKGSEPAKAAPTPSDPGAAALLRQSAPAGGGSS